MLNPAYKPVSLRAVGTPPGHHDVVGLALDVPGGGAAEALRFHFSREDAERTALALLDAVSIQRYREAVCQFHSDTSSGSPSNEGSPQSGQEQCPPASSSSADCADANGPSKQSSSSQSIQPRGC